MDDIALRFQRQAPRRWPFGRMAERLLLSGHRASDVTADLPSVGRTVTRAARHARTRAIPVAVVLISAAVSAQTSPVTIQVRTPDGMPVPHAVVIGATTHPLVTDDSGRVAIRFAADSVTLTIRRIGYVPFHGLVRRQVGGATPVHLQPIAQRMQTVTVSAERMSTPLERSGFYDRVLRAQRGAYNAEFVTPEELDARLGARLSDLFHGRRFVHPQRSPGGASQVYLLGRGGCKMTIYLDGQMVHAEPPRGQSAGTRGHPVGGGFNDPNAIVALDDIVQLSQVAAIEMYSSAANAPVELIPLVGSAQAAACGVVAIWTGARH